MLSAVENPNLPAKPPEQNSRAGDIWLRLRGEAQDAIEAEPDLAGFYAIVTGASSLEEALVTRLATRLGNGALPSGPLSRVFLEAIRADHRIAAAMRADALAVVERDPAAGRLL